MDVSEVVVEDANISALPSHSPIVVNRKEIALQTTATKIKCFRSVETQTENTLTEGTQLARQTNGIKMKEHNNNMSSHLEDHSYSAIPLKSVDQSPDVAENDSSDGDSDGNQSVCISDDISAYSPGSSSEDNCTDDEEEIQVPVPEEKKIIVCQSQLNKLFRVCQDCGSIITAKTKHFQGSMFIMKTTCLNGHLNTWQSQPLVNGTAFANLLIPAAILFSGNTYKSINNFAEFLNLQFVSSSHFYCIQKNLLFPAIQNAWNTSQSDIFQQLKQVQHIHICGDGRCDNPGHSANYGTYSLLDENSGKVVEFSVAQVTEVT